jgi:hypothetical protein
VHVRQVNRFVILAGAATLVGCATEAPAPATIPAHPVTASATTPAEKIKLPEGYMKITVNGEDRYCRDDLDTGSRVQHTKICLTAEQLKASQEGTQSMLNQMQNRNGIGAAPTGGTPGVGGH